MVGHVYNPKLSLSSHLLPNWKRSSYDLELPDDSHKDTLVVTHSPCAPAAIFSLLWVMRHTWHGLACRKHSLPELGLHSFLLVYYKFKLCNKSLMKNCGLFESIAWWCIGDRCNNVMWVKRIAHTQKILLIKLPRLLFSRFWSAV